jgi:DNA-binding GntR family transcriptional regulator
MAGEDSWKYERIAGGLRARIRNGEYAPGSRLPSKNELKAIYGVSDGPVNEAVRVLRGEGLVETRQGSGIFVCDPLPEKALSEYEIVMGRFDELAEEVRRLREEVAEVKRAREA